MVRKWKMQRLDEVCPLQRGFDLPTRDLMEGPYPVVYSNGILNFHENYKSRGPGVITGRSGTIGKVTFVEEDYWPHNTSLWVTDFKGNVPKYIYYLLQSLRIERFNAGTSVPTLNRNLLHPVKVPVPPLPEQRKIAEILSCWDRAIEKTEELIEKEGQHKDQILRDIVKKVQNENWPTCTLCDIAVVNKNTLSGKTSENYRFTYIDISSVSKGQIEYPLTEIAFKGAPSRARRIVKEGDILMSMVRPNLQSIAIVESKKKCLIASTGFGVLSARKNIVPQYLYQMLFSSSIMSQIEAFITGSNYPAINSGDVENLKIPLPSSDIQTNFANVLSTSDRKLSILRDLCGKYRKQKFALMNRLFSGSCVLPR